MKRNAGFTLIELMIAVTLGLIVLAALTSFFVRTSYNRSELERTSRQIENGRYAISTLRDDMMLAGFYADITSSAAVWETPAACETTTTAMGWTANVLNPHLPVPVFIYPLGAGRPTACTPNYLAGTDVIVVRRFNSEPIAVASAVANLPYVQVSECSTDVAPNVPFVFNTGTGGGFAAKARNCSTVASLWRYREQVYYVRDYSVNVGDGIPTLVRMELDVDSSGARVMNPVPLVEGIENLRMDLGVDNDGDGAPDQWRRCEAATPCTMTDYSNVMAAKVYVLSRNLEQTRDYVDNKTYDLGVSGGVTASGDQYKRHVYSALISLPNRVGPREPSLAS
ncbi:MAG TPA: PilW family protein [Usitatibacter sp.]|nr:PilW family protein [Usitatibacter sp.]